MTRRIGVVLAMMLLGGLSGALQAQEAKDTTAILDKAIKALGGEEALSKVKTISWKAKTKINIMGGDRDFTTQAVMQGMDHFRQDLEGEFDGNKFQVVTVLAGDKGSRTLAGNRTELDKNAIANQKRTLYLTLIPATILPLKSKDFKTEAIAEEKIGDKPAVGIKVTPPDGKEFKIYFDKESGLPMRTVAKVVGFMGEEFTQETNFSDYKELKELTKDTPKELGGIKKATKLVSKRDGEKFIDQQITEFKILDKADPKTFTE
jgi:hypothetical protein